MILVTVGTHDVGFNRLVKAMDELAATLNEQVVIQRGSSTYEPKYAEYFQLTTSQHMEQLTEQARVVVAHAAAGSIMVTLLRNKPLVVIPRLLRFGESIDDHQLQLAKALDAQSRAVTVYEPSADTLRIAIDNAMQQRVQQHDGPTQLVHALRKQLTDWALPNKRGEQLARRVG
jgi:UDP-N-acetylglucosamine transferase subunit ALG13